MNIRYLLALCVLVFAGCNKPAEPAAPPRPTLTMLVGSAAGSSSMVLVGEVRARYEASQSFRISGKIMERKVDVGAQVKKGHGRGSCCGGKPCLGGG